MALFQGEFFSQALGKSTKVRIVFNENQKGPFPVYYLLHGYTDDETIWTRRTSLERYAADYPFMIVMPDGGKGWYCDSGYGAYETYIAKELPEWIDRLFPTVKGREGRVIGGLSMGGYGAMRLGLRYPDCYQAIASHSAAFGFPTAARFAAYAETARIQKEVKPSELDVMELVLKVPRKKLPQIYFDCGRDDFLKEQNAQFRKHLLKHRIPHEFHWFPGAHDWSYWDAHIQGALRFMEKALPKQVKR